MKELDRLAVTLEESADKLLTQVEKFNCGEPKEFEVARHAA
jgi:hypothetical protein